MRTLAKLACHFMCMLLHPVKPTIFGGCNLREILERAPKFNFRGFLIFVTRISRT